MIKNYCKYFKSENDTKFYLNDEGQPHRLDGPALEYSKGSKHWYINGNRHQNIDPSEDYSNGEKVWCFINKRHRVGGSNSSVLQYWYIHGKEYTKEEYFNKVWDI